MVRLKRGAWKLLFFHYREESGHEDELETSRSLLPNLHQRRFTCPQLIAWNKQNSFNSTSLEESQESNQISIISARKFQFIVATILIAFKN
jgi:hypothetical protein